MARYTLEKTKDPGVYLMSRYAEDGVTIESVVKVYEKKKEVIN